MKVIYIIPILFLFFSCGSDFSTPEMRNNFSKNEIKDLEKIVSFYKNQLSNKKQSKFEDSFNDALNNFMYNENRDDFYNINFDDQKMLYNSISKSTFNEIWSYNKSYMFEKSETYKTIGFKNKGKYNSFLKEVVKKDTIIKEYLNRLESAGDFNNSNYFIYDIIKNKDLYNLKDPNIQLVIAIDNLSINDIRKRKEKFN